ncbi:MAG: hypothetical protein JXB47_17425 [Anaerolineae bacterium]|nr:hypothetical protein [Anaerolineae bacterium]
MTATLETIGLRLVGLEDENNVITGLALEVRDGDGWYRMAATKPLSHVIYQDPDGNRREVDIGASEYTAGDARLELRGGFVDADGATWRLTAVFSTTDDPCQLQADYRLEVNASRKVFCWIGPSLHAGAGSFGAAKDEALFPGLEYLLDDEPSSDTRFAAEKYANRAVPHPYKIAIPLMAVSHEGRAVGLMWDATQAWGSAWRRPAAIFASPNCLQGQDNHWMALSTPAVEPRWRNEGELEAHEPYGLGPGSPSTLSARLVALPSGGVIGVVRAWVAAYGLPALPDPGHDYEQNVDLCARSFLDIAWDEDAEGWHHTLSDPWGPRYEPVLAALLWRYSRWIDGDPVLRARAADQVHRAVARCDKPPHLDLALAYGRVAGALDDMVEASRKAIDEQEADGSWTWTPDVVADIADFKSEDRLKIMGAEKDSSSGFTASRVSRRSPLLQYALCTGNAGAVDAVLCAADWCNAQRRPEGAQTWELHLHVPDVLAVPYLIDLNLGAYELTGEARYLDAANRWAWTGLPFTYLWSGYYRPVMRYGTIPVFGVTFHDVQSWFGVIVHWNGLVYARSLFQLAQYCAGDGPIDWRELAEGIALHGMQEQALGGPWMGMYPDAFSPVKGDEEYTWWLNPQLIGLNTFPLAGLHVGPEPVILRRADGSRVHVTGGAAVAEARLGADGALRLVLDDQPGAFSHTLVANGGKRPARVVCAGARLDEVGDVDAVAQGWQWLDAHGTALIKVQHGAGAVAVHCILD